MLFIDLLLLDRRPYGEGSATTFLVSKYTHIETLSVYEGLWFADHKGVRYQPESIHLEFFIPIIIGTGGQAQMQQKTAHRASLAGKTIDFKLLN